ncbi:hypothetical protein [Rhizobium leguminosarum]|nr:hypothetical protein [Rhizobium leguminosarum]
MTVNKLVEIYAKANYAVSAVGAARREAHHPGPLWYHAIGLFNAFYAINEELRKRTKNGNDVHLTAAVDAWWQSNRDVVSAFFGDARNTATHQGEIVTEAFVEWELDVANDTEHPIAKASVTVKNSTIKKMPGVEFLDLCERALTFMRDGVLAINADYKARGGIDHALPDNRYKNLF